MKKKTKVVYLEKPLSGWKLLLATLAEYRDNWLPYGKIVAIVAIPSDVLSLWTAVSTDALTSAYISIAALIMNVTLIWSIVRHHKSGHVPTVRESYYDASAALIRFILLSLAMVLMLIPAAFGAALYETGLVAANAVSASSGIQLIVLAVAFVVALPSFFLLIRYSMAPFALMEQAYRPGQAFRYSRRLTTGRFWPIVGRFAMLFLFLIVLSIPLTAVSVGISFLHAGNAGAIIFEILTTLITLPIANIFIFRMYRSLVDTLPEEQAKAPAEKDLQLAETAA